MGREAATPRAVRAPVIELSSCVRQRVESFGRHPVTSTFVMTPVYWPYRAAIRHAAEIPSPITPAGAIPKDTNHSAIEPCPGRRTFRLTERIRPAILPMS